MITLAEALEQCDFFRNLPKDVTFDVISSMRQSALQPKEVLFQQGDNGDRFFIVLKGVLKVLDTSQDGAEVVLSLLGPVCRLAKLLCWMVALAAQLSLLFHQSALPALITPLSKL